jgi:hypothetical protein
LNIGPVLDCARSNIIAPFGTTRKAARERVSVLWDTVRADEVIE